MAEEKFIVIGCDDMAKLSAIMHHMKGTVSFPHHIISATRVTDLITIVRSQTPDLIILCFHNNQLVLSNVISFVKKPGIPLLCLTDNFETRTLRWNVDNIVFTYPLEHINDEGQLSSRINSVFLLKAGSSKNNTGKSLVDAAMMRNESAQGTDLSRYVLELDQKAEFLLKIKDRIADLYPRVDDPIRAELTSIVNTIKMSANDNKLWDDFKLYFEQANPGFLLSLSKKCPMLTPIDLKYCCYLKMNMSNDDIRNLLCINQESVRTHKYRLKKKLRLSKEQDLRTFLRSVDRRSIV
jgi:DNA-binding CsgD family transcriptional regulator